SDPHSNHCTTNSNNRRFPDVLPSLVRALTIQGHAITRLAMIVIAVIPAIYGGLYLASNWSPTDNLDKLQAAVVNEDTGAEKPDSDGETLHAGDELVDEITPE